MGADDEHVEWRVAVTADKPGRSVTVDIDQLDTGAWAPSLAIGPAGIVADHWTWLTTGEAREVAARLTAAADAADMRNGGRRDE
jgi:hypothetical protein